jgi:uncharacterized membrane protein
MRFLGKEEEALSRCLVLSMERIEIPRWSLFPFGEPGCFRFLSSSLELPAGGVVVQNLLKQYSPIILWGLFFMTDLYGHVILKMTLGRELTMAEMTKRLLGSWTGWSIFLAWGLAGLLWVCVLSKNTLFQTNSISMINYILICLSAVWFLGENLHEAQWIGMGLIGLGVYLTGK